MFMSQFLFGQDKALKIKYTETFFLDAVIKNVPPQFAANIPKSRDLKKILFATDNESMYFDNKEDKDPEPTEPQNGGRMRMMNRMMGGGNIVHFNADDLKMTTKTEFFGKEFLIEEEKDFAWKINSGEQRDILGNTCIKATFMQDTLLVTAWYAPKIPQSVGPDGYQGLPGVILALSVGEDKVYLATSIEKDATMTQPMEVPTKGEKMTRAQFKKMSEEKIAEMRKNFGGGGAGAGRTMIFRQ